MTPSARLRVPPERLARWVDNFAARHGPTALAVDAGELMGRAADGSWCRLRLPFDEEYAGAADVPAFAGAAAGAVPADWGVLLVRKGGFAVARLELLRVVSSKVGQRHVQGRTKAGGQSQQRFARRRDNQARQAYEAAADHAARVLDGLAAGSGPVVVGGDRTAVDEVLADARLRPLAVAGPWLAVPDPRRAVLEQAVRDACAVAVEVQNA
jgi:predicted NBD/HSP70 family sugar kinase